MLFGRRKPTPLPEASRMGFRSRLVLAKLGFDLRQRYDDLLGRELPDELGRLASQLSPNVVEVGKEPIRRGRRWSNHWRRWKGAIARRSCASKPPQGQSARNSSTAFSNSV
jgi:hypothetical protein